MLDPLFEASARDSGGNYVGIEFMPGWRFGIDRDVYKLARGVEDVESAGALLSFLIQIAMVRAALKAEVQEETACS